MVRGDRLFEILAVCICTRIGASGVSFVAGRRTSFWMSLCRASTPSNGPITPAVYIAHRLMPGTGNDVLIVTSTILYVWASDNSAYKWSHLCGCVHLTSSA